MMEEMEYKLSKDKVTLVSFLFLENVCTPISTMKYEEIQKCISPGQVAISQM
jgi:hypothetical protein